MTAAEKERIKASQAELETEADEDRSILSEQDLNDLDSVVLDLEDEDEEEDVRREALRKKILFFSGAALFAAAVTVTVLILTRKKDTK